MRQAVSTCTLYQVTCKSLALQPLSARNSTEFSQADNSKTIQHSATNLTSLDSLVSGTPIPRPRHPSPRTIIPLEHPSPRNSNPRGTPIPPWNTDPPSHYLTLYTH